MIVRLHWRIQSALPRSASLRSLEPALPARSMPTTIAGANHPWPCGVDHESIDFSVGMLIPPH
jgi:hypothetical protein